MNIKKITFAVIATFLVSNLLTTIWYMATDDANYVPYRREEINFLGLMFNHLLYALLFVIMFTPYYERKPSISSAFVYGLLMSAVMFIPTGIVVRSIWKVDFNTIFFFNSMVHLIIGGIMGLLVSAIYNFQKSN